MTFSCFSAVCNNAGGGKRERPVLPSAGAPESSTGPPKSDDLEAGVGLQRSQARGWRCRGYASPFHTIRDHLENEGKGHLRQQWLGVQLNSTQRGTDCVHRPDVLRMNAPELEFSATG